MIALALFLISAAESPGGQAYRLGAGEYRWLPIVVKQTPASVEVKYEVLKGGPTVHAELLAIEDFQNFNRGKSHRSIIDTDNAKLGSFRKIVVVPGQYRLILVNAPGGAVATVSCEVHTEANPKGGVSTELPTSKRIFIIFCSFLVFVSTVTFSGVRLVKAMRGSD